MLRIGHRCDSIAPLAELRSWEQNHNIASDSPPAPLERDGGVALDLAVAQKGRT